METIRIQKEVAYECSTRHVTDTVRRLAQQDFEKATLNGSDFPPDAKRYEQPRVEDVQGHHGEEDRCSVKSV